MKKIGTNQAQCQGSTLTKSTKKYLLLQNAPKAKILILKVMEKYIWGIHLNFGDEKILGTFCQNRDQQGTTFAQFSRNLEIGTELSALLLGPIFIL